MINTYVSIDLETTGLNPKEDRIIEIGAVKVIEGRVADTFSTFINPGRKLEERIVELTGNQDENLTVRATPLVVSNHVELVQHGFVKTYG